jgi:hypothetical protein
MRCQSGQVPTGWGLERRDTGTAIAVAGARRTRRGYVFDLTNTGAAPAALTPRIRCLGRTQDGGSGLTHSFRLRSPSFEDSGRSARHSCRRGEYSVSAGASLDPAAGVFLSVAIPNGPRGARWRLSGDAAATTQLVCLARGTRFR